MPDTTPDPTTPVTRVIDRAQEHLAELNIGLAYTPDLPNRETHLLTVQALVAALGALRDDL